MNDKLPESEVSEMLSKLAEHFGEPVLPVSKYCNALKTWAKLIIEGNQSQTCSQGSEY